MAMIGALVEYPLMMAVLGIDQVWPMPAMPVEQPVSSVKLGQPSFHLYVGDPGLVTSKP